ncbi:uncharacterized protein ARMOST_20885 [Armillaria ostoyae]|uniref:Uncharacterized protein n=1 Tax=Armillaria ostoyae TaxID=47428 RepID=A0A284S8J1_ARMOS|nr:uncharacterized protein ARMOST_20885 [Armillaria ostoyae]
MGTSDDTDIPPSDSGSAFSVTIVNIALSGDYSEHFCYRVISQMVRMDKISTDMVIR